MNLVKFLKYPVIFLIFLFVTGCGKDSEKNTTNMNQNKMTDTMKTQKTTTVNTDEIVARIQKLRMDTENRLKDMTKKEIDLSNKTQESEIDELKWDKMDAFFDGGKLLRFELFPQKAKSTRTEEFYFNDGKLAFAVINSKGADLKEGKDEGTPEREFYFDNDKLVKYVNKSGVEDRNAEDVKKEFEVKLVDEANDFMKYAMSSMQNSTMK